MGRYFYYHVIYVGMINVMLFVPAILIHYRFTGAVPSMVIAIVVSTLMSFVVISSYQRFPSMGLPEIMKNNLPFGFAVLMNIYGAIIWFLAGMLVIYSYAQTIQQFFNPDMNRYLFFVLMLAAGMWGATRCTRTVQFAHEACLILCAPLVLMILFKAIFSQWLSWDAIRVTAGYIKTRPSLISFCAATFVFSGYANLAVFNRLIPSETKIRFKWIIPVFCTFFMFVSFFIPIGFHGTVAVGDYIYIWSVTSDSMIMEYGFIYRVLYIFLLLYTALSLLFAMNTWHTAMEFIKACHPKYEPKPEQSPVPPVNWWINLAFGLLSVGYVLWSNEQRNQMVTIFWLVSRFITEAILMVLLVVFVIRKYRKKKKEYSSPPKDAVTSDS